MDDKERLLSVLPLHHTFEFSCGLLLPLVAGGQIFTLDELTGERVLYALNTSRATAMVGVPALWQLLGRRVESRIQERGPAFERGARALLFVNRKLNDLGLDIGKKIFFPVHKELGGELKTLISGGAALPSDVHQLFRDLGLPLAEGYGLTEAAPVLTVADSSTRAAGTVGAPIPGVEIKIDNPDDRGVGEVLARGGNVMLGYFEDDAATHMSLTDDGWLRTGDLGKLDHAGKLALVGRAKDVVVTSSGENIYLDDAEALLRAHTAQDASFVLVGNSDGRGGERLALVFAGDTSESELKRGIKKLPPFSRPTLIKRYSEADLPRTATLKVKRKEVARWLESAVEDAPKSKAPARLDVKTQRVLEAVATVTGQSKKSLDVNMRLLEDLGFDSLMWVELGSALEPLMGKLDPERLAACETIHEVAALDRAAAARPVEDHVEREVGVRLPSVVKAPLRRLLARAQKDLYKRAFPAEVLGRAHIPQNEACIVVANHCSHLDTGLVKFALGQYGARLRPLAAKDYFFEGNAFKVTAVKELTNLAPIDRGVRVGSCL